MDLKVTVGANPSTYVPPNVPILFGDDVVVVELRSAEFPIVVWMKPDAATTTKVEYSVNGSDWKDAIAAGTAYAEFKFDYNVRKLRASRTAGTGDNSTFGVAH